VNQLEAYGEKAIVEHKTQIADAVAVAGVLMKYPGGHVVLITLVVLPTSVNVIL
jgi:hypothetical protein